MCCFKRTRCTMRPSMEASRWSFPNLAVLVLCVFCHFSTVESVAMGNDTYESPLATRNASREMLRLFSPQHKFGLWRRLWVELARAEAQLGISRISDEAIAQMMAKMDEIDFDRAADWEKRLRHDVMAHVHKF